MKKALIAVLCMLLAGLCACGAVIEIDPNEFAPYVDVVNERIKFFRSISDKSYDYLPTQYYTLYDIDGNGTKELLLGSEEWGALVLIIIYAIQDGVAVEQRFRVMGEGGSAFPSLLFENGVIRVDSGDDSGRYIIYYCFENGALICPTALVDRYGEYYLDDGWPGTPITKEEFDRVQREMEGDGQTVALDWKPLAEYGR